jgi:hypothetical protein
MLVWIGHQFIMRFGWTKQNSRAEWPWPEAEDHVKQYARIINFILIFAFLFFFASQSHTKHNYHIINRSINYQ